MSIPSPFLHYKTIMHTDNTLCRKPLSVICGLYTLFSIFFCPVSATYSPKLPSHHFMPGVSEETYGILGDINIGAFIYARESTGFSSDRCTEHVYQSTYVIRTTEEIAFAVDLVNRDKSLLPNITLGFIGRDACRSAKIALATSHSFLPRSETVCNGTVCYTQILQSQDSPYHSHDVIGVLAPPFSVPTVPISILYGVAHLPLIGHITTSDELSDKANHPYFFRVVPPDKYMIQALLTFISRNGWSYVSVLYDSGTWGEKAFESMKFNIEDYGICIAYSHRLDGSKTYHEVVSNLLQNPWARVVLLFTEADPLKELIQNTIYQNATGHFIWIGTDQVSRYTGHDYEGVDHDPVVGAFAFDVFASYMPGYYEFLRSQTLATSKNPFLRRIWEYLFQCSFKNGTCDENNNLLESEKIDLNELVSLKVDSVLAFAHAAHNLLSDRCPDARGADARACITGEIFHEYLKNVSFEGYSGHIEFDENQDVRGKYVISQFVFGDYKYPHVPDYMNEKRIWKKHIGVYDIQADTLTYFNETISWSHLNNLSRIVPWSNTSSISINVPESVCSRPCLITEYKIEKELPCCWECRVCRENERIVSWNMSCERCAEFEWPDVSTGYRTCSPIPLTYLKPSDLLSVILICLAIAVIVVTILIFVGYIVYRNERVVKAGSRELSLLQLVAIIAGYVTVLVFQSKPTDETCGAIYFMFSMSFAWLYSPLLVKTIRIYRIFRSGSNNIKRPRFISPQSQLTIAAFLIIVQLVLCLVTFFISKPTARKNQPIWSEKLVELSCDPTLMGLTSFLSYNLILVCLCSVFAFKTRKLPDNFNESKFISMCVSTTLVIWLAFIPTYFTADREVVRVLLLSTALLLNHTVALLFLFVPKLYVAMFLRPENPENSNAATRFQTSASIFSLKGINLSLAVQQDTTGQHQTSWTHPSSSTTPAITITSSSKGQGQ